MSENIQGHLIKYKVGDVWVEIPVAVISMYAAYLAYCEQNNIPAEDILTETEYYYTIGTIKKYAEDLAGSTDKIAALTAALSTGTLPVTLGGTGKAFTNEAALIAWFRANLVAANNNDNTGFVSNSAFSEKTKTLETSLNTKLNTSEIKYGTAAPTTKTGGSLYFQYE